MVAEMKCTRDDYETFCEWKAHPDRRNDICTQDIHGSVYVAFLAALAIGRRQGLLQAAEIAEKKPRIEPELSSLRYIRQAIADAIRKEAEKI